MSTTDQTAEDVFQSLTGYDEIAISKQFGGDPYALREHPFTFLRALIFVNIRRGDVKDAEAYRRAMDLTMGDVGTYFATDTEVMADEPVTATGKGVKPST